MLHPIAEAFPEGTVPGSTVRQKLAEAIPLVLQQASDIDELDFQAADAVAVPWLIILNGVNFTRYPAGDGGESDYIAFLVAISGECYRSEIGDRRFANVLDIVDGPPGDAALADRYLASAAPTGEFVDGANKLYVLTNHGWEGTMPEIGISTYVIAKLGKYHFGADGAWHEGDGAFTVGAASVGPRELKKPFGPVVESETALPPAALISYALGTALGDMTGNGGLAAASDGDAAQAAADCAAKASAVSGWVGRTHTSKLSYVTVVPSTDDGFADGAAVNMTLQLYGKTGAAPSDETDGVLLGAVGPFADVTTAVDIGSNDADTEWDHRWVRLIAASARALRVGEMKAYAPSSPAADTSWLVAPNGLGVFAGHDTDVAVADGAGGLAFFPAYNGAVVFDDAAGIKKRFDGAAGTWISDAGIWINRAVTEHALGGDVTTIAGSHYDWAAGTFPTTSTLSTRDDHGLQFKATAQGNKLVLNYQAAVLIDVAAGGIGTGSTVLAVLIDDDVMTIAKRLLPDADYKAGEAVMRMINLNLEFEAPDNAIHTYRLLITRRDGTGGTTINSAKWTSRRIEIQEEGD